MKCLTNSTLYNILIKTLYLKPDLLSGSQSPGLTYRCHYPRLVSA